MTTTKQILNAFAQYLATATTIGLAFRPDGSAYQAGEIPIVKGTERSTLDAQLVLNWVTLSDDVEVTQGAGMLQVACIGSQNDADSAMDLSDAVFEVLHGLTGLPCGDASITQCYRQSSVPMGQDQNTRQERADHYYCDVEMPPIIHRP